jgi:F-type H+-transporting ATPase subunit gamma
VSGSGLISIKRRIKSVTNTNKITRAMGLVATSKFRKTKEELEINQLYTNSFSSVLIDVLRNHDVENVYKDGNNSKKKLYIVLTSDTGLCGAFNANIINKAVEEISQDKENSIIMVIGAKGISYFSRFNYEVAIKYTDIPDIPRLGDANDFAAAALEMYDNEEVGQISIVYAHFISQSNHEVVIEKVLPLEEGNSFKGNSIDNFVVFEPGINSVLNDLIPLYMRERILNYLLQSKTSEQAARMTSMDGATKNANEMLDKLKLQFNRMRQSAITQEISEIVGGAEAQK